MLKKTLCLCCLLWVCIYGNAQEVTIEGTLTSSSTKEIIPTASVVVKNGKTIVGYNYSNDLGVFTIIFQRKKQDTLTLQINSLGYEQINAVIILSDEENNYTKDFQLTEKIESLSTVVLRPDQKIKINRDTITFKVNAFKDDSERTVEDMLKKLPGIEVDDDGNIRALGKPIQKILIEGDDLADSNYKVISRNLDSDVLDKVEILSNYEENPVLKQFLNSENVALNLKLKKGKKNILFGRIEAGGGIENRFLADANLGLITPALKFLDLANANNVGDAAGAEFNNYNFTYGGFNDFSKTFGINQNPIVYLQGSNLELEDKNYIENTTFANNLLINKRFSDSLKLRNSLFFYSDSFEKQYTSNIRYFVEPDDILFTEQNRFDLDNINGANDLEVQFTPSQNSNLVFTNSVSITNEQHDNRLLFNGDRIDQLLENNKKELESQLQYTQKIKNGAAVVDFYVGSKNLKQDFKIFPDTFSEESPSDNNSLDISHINTLDYQGLDAALVFKNGNTSYSFTTGVEHLNETINSETFSREATQRNRVDSLSGRNGAQSITPHLQFKLEHELVKNLFISTDLDAAVNFYEKNDDKRTFFLPNPSAGIRLQKTKLGSFRFKYGYKTQISRLTYFTENFLVKSYRSLTLGTQDVTPLKSHNYSLGHTFNKIEKRILISSSLNYTRFENELSFRDLLNQDLDISRTIFIPGQELLFFNTGFTSYLDAIDTSYKLGFNQQFSNKPVTINDQELNLKTNTSSYYFSGTTYFKGALNFKVLAQYSINKGENATNIVRNARYKFELKTVLKFSESLIATIESKGYIISSQFYETNNALIEYRPKQKDWSIGLKVQNIFNTDTYIFENASDFVQSETVYRAVPRYGILYGSFRF